MANDIVFLNVKDFGAVGDEDTDDWQHIRDTFHKATSLGVKNKGVIIFFPPGIYRVTDSIVIPRIDNGSLIIRGSGMQATHITGGPGFPIEKPVVTFSSHAGNPTGYEISDLLINRATLGTALYHPSTGDSQRLMNCTFRNLMLDSININNNTYDTCVIEGGLNSTFENLVIKGGNTAMVLKNSSHCILSNIHQTLNNLGLSHNALHIVGGGSHKLTEIRSEAIDGAALILESCSSIVIDNIYTEGKQTRYTVKMQGSYEHPTQDIIIHHLGIASPAPPVDGLPKYGLFINEFTRNVRVLGGTMFPWRDAKNNPIPGNNIRIEGGAEHIWIENMHFFNNVGEYPLDDGESPILNIEAKAIDINVSIIDWNSASDPTLKKYKRWERSIGTVGELTNASYDPMTGHVQDFKVMKTNATGKMNRLIQGTRANAPVNEVMPSAGRTLTLIGTGHGLVLSKGGNIRFAKGENGWADPKHSTISLVFDGMNWLETCRSQT